MEGVPPRRADVAALPAVAERCAARRPRPLGDPGPGGVDGDRQGDCPITLQLMLYAQILALLLAIPAGVYAAYRANRRGDRVTTTVSRCGFLSIPNFVLAIVLVLFLAIGGIAVVRHAGRLGVPAGIPLHRRSGTVPTEHFKHMALPTIALALGLAAAYMRVLRSDMISTLQENFITTAKAKGVPDRRILLGHALRPSSFTLLTVFGRQTRRADRRRPGHRDDLLAARSGHPDRHGHLPEGLPRRPGRGRRHRRRRSS